MARPHPLLVELAAGRMPDRVVDQAGLIESAIEHRMTGLLASWAQQHWVERVLLDRISALELADWSRQTVFADVLGSLWTELRADGIEVAVLKGLSVETRWYEKVGERPSSDIDLVIAPHCTPRVGSLVGRLDPRHPLAGSSQELIDHGHIQGVEFCYRGVSVDLHVDPFKLGIRVDGRELWDRSVLFELPNGDEVRTLDAEGSLISLLVANNRDHFGVLRGLADVARIVSKEELDWEFVQRFARQEGLEVLIFNSLRAICDELELEMPVVPPTGGPAHLVWDLIWRPSSRLMGDAAVHHYKKSRLVMPFLVRGRRRDAARWLMRWAFPPPEIIAFYYPQTRGPRIWRILAGRFTGVVRRLR